MLYLMTFQQLKLAIFYIVMVGLSILENLGQMNASLPKFIHENLEVLKQKGEHTDS
ncbi:phage holin family protein [Priestia aryabhattai]|uniref:phage holin family protein n=1 Tax=Priestia megaterium TaxID=1404 RepID=UPI0039B99397